MSMSFAAFSRRTLLLLLSLLSFAFCAGAQSYVSTPRGKPEKTHNAELARDPGRSYEFLLYSFAGVPDGAQPVAGLIQDAEGNLYGTTSRGGANGLNNDAGTVFKVDNKGNETVLYNFCSQGGSNCTDGSAPTAGLIQDAAGNLYGTTSYGGKNGLGTVFKVDNAGNESVLYNFCPNGFANCTDGAVPQAGLIRDAAGNLYGTTYMGGSSSSNNTICIPRGCGTVFKVDNAGNETVLYNFCSSYPYCTDGSGPDAVLIQDDEGNLYGTTNLGGANLNGLGTVFKLTPSGGTWTETVLYNFCSDPNCTDGSHPQAGLLRDAATGNLYGTTVQGGANSFGTVFKLTQSGGNWTETVLYSFCSAHNCTDGSSPVAGLIEDQAGNLFGTTVEGGLYNGGGTVFMVDNAGIETVLYNFCTFKNCTDGSGPYAGLIQDAASGNLYGTTKNGGASNLGTVFGLENIYLTYTLTVSTSGSGTVTSTDGFIDCPGTCTHTYNYNDPVTLNASPATGWSFSGWGGACSGTGSCNITMTQNQSVSATFALGDTLTVSTSGSGSVTSTDGFINCPGTCSHLYAANSQVTLNATPASGWAFSGWTGPCSGVGSCKVTMTQSLFVTAVFIEPGYGLQFVPVTPCRLVDTRQTGDPIQGGTSQSYTLPQLGGCNIPTSAAAYSLNVTVVPHTTLQYLTIWPTGEAQPYVSTMNSPDGRIKANAAIVSAGTSGAVSIYVTDTSDVILDIDGYFAQPGSGTYQLYPLPPCRLVDTRQTNGQLGGPRLQAGTPRDFPLLSSTCIPSGLHPLAYSLNFTVVPNPGGQLLDYLTVWPAGEMQPTVSTLNNFTATVVANAAIVPAGTNGDIDVYASQTTDLLIDINGYFAAPGTGGFSLYPVAPCRVLDTRQNNGKPFMGEKTVNVEGSACAPPSNAAAYVFNATVVPPGPMLYLTLWPDGEKQPTVSTLNAEDGFITSNMAIVPTNNGSIDAYAAGLTQLILDISGYFAP